MPMGKGMVDWEVANVKAKAKSFHDWINAYTPATTIEGMAIGTNTLQIFVHVLPPSTSTVSSNSRGMCRINPAMLHKTKGNE